MKHFRFLFVVLAGWVLLVTSGMAAISESEVAARKMLVAAILSDGAEQQKLVGALADTGEPIVSEVLTAWKQESVFLQVLPDGRKVPFLQKDGGSVRIDTGDAFPEGTAKQAVDTTAKLRKSIKACLDLLALASPDPMVRASAVTKLGMEQRQENLSILDKRQAAEKVASVQRAIAEARALTLLASKTASERISAAYELAALNSIGSLDLLKKAVGDPDPSVSKAAKLAVNKIEVHLSRVNFLGTIFRGLSLGSVLLVVALGLAITLGLMGVINMAHGEMMAIGAYTTYAVHGIFSAGLFIPCFGAGLHIPGMNCSGGRFDFYFLVALPSAFLTSALAGIVLERGVIRFLYKRPLESLLATWGVSLILQQLFRQMFGANNVQVYSPSWLSGNFTLNDIIFGWNRIFVIVFAIGIVLGTWALLVKTPVGLLIRAVTQNREMAACMGVRTERVNMLTFAFGSGLAGLAGAFLSQIGNVGPSLGQTYIVDAFMTVVAGGVGNIMGTVFSAVGIGVSDQTLQQALSNPVLGKIIVLCATILFLQWKPGGLFPTRSRSLEG